MFPSVTRHRRWPQCIFRVINATGRERYAEVEVKEKLLFAVSRKNRGTQALRLEARREARLDAEEGMLEGVTLWPREGLPQQTHSLIENPPRSTDGSLPNEGGSQQSGTSALGTQLLTNC